MRHLGANGGPSYREAYRYIDRAELESRATAEKRSTSRFWMFNMVVGGLTFMGFGSGPLAISVGIIAAVASIALFIFIERESRARLERFRRTLGSTIFVLDHGIMFEGDSRLFRLRQTAPERNLPLPESLFVVYESGKDAVLVARRYLRPVDQLGARSG